MSGFATSSHPDPLQREVVRTYIGIDAHKRTCHATVMSQDGTIVSEKTFPTNVKYLEAFALSLPEDAMYAIEAGTVTKRLYWHLRKMGRSVKMAHPTEIRRMMGSKKKTDRLDSAFLADLLRMGRLPEAYVPEPEEDEKRQLLRYRMDLARKASAIKNQVHALLASVGVSEGSITDLFGRYGREMMRTLRLTRQQRYILDNYLRQLDLLVLQMKDTERAIAELAQKDPAARALMQIRGIDFYSALVILNEIGDITRFPTAKHLTSYAGLVPKVYQSGDVARIGRIHKEGPKRLRATLVRCAYSAVKGPCRFQRTYRRLEKRKGSGKAIVAVARKMLATIFVLLTRGCDYVEVDEGNARRKIRRMERIAKELPDMTIEETMSNVSETTREVLRGEENNTFAG
jgi:transposase